MTEKVIGKLRGFANWLVHRRSGKICLWGVAILFTAVVLMYQVANWGGARAWAKAVAMLEAEGETLEFLELAPETGPPEENFGALPALDGIGVVEESGVEKGPGAELRRRLESLGLAAKPVVEKPTGKGRGFRFGKGCDLDAWVKYLAEGGRFSPPENSAGAARDILEALRPADELVAELAAGVERPNAVLVPRWEKRVPANPFEMILPHYQSMQTAARFFSLRAAAAARAGDETVALESILISLKLSRLAATDGLLISVLVARARLEMALDSLWEGLDAGVFSAESLVRIQAELGEFDFREMMLAAMRTEMAATTQSLEWAKKQDAGDIISAVGGVEVVGVLPEGVDLFHFLGKLVFRLSPEGWIDRNKATIVDWNHNYYIAPLKSGSLLDVVDVGEELEDRIIAAKTGFDPHALFASVIMPVYGRVAEKMVYAQTTLDLAVAACAVEAYAADRDAYPRNLEDLVPKYLDAVPADRVNPEGGPLRYLRYVEGGRCRLWSVGWDGEDDGGKRELDPAKPEETKFDDEKYAGDWVWNYAK